MGATGGRASGRALLALGLAVASGAWWFSSGQRPSTSLGDESLVPNAQIVPGVGAADTAAARLATPRREASTSVEDSTLELHGTLGDAGEDDLWPLDPDRARTRDWFGEYLRLEHSRSGALGELASDVLAGEGPRAQKVALLRALHDAPAADALVWLEHAVRTLPDVVGARGESVPSIALGLIARAAQREPAARAKLAELAFRAPELPASLRRRSATLVAAHCPVDELGELRRQLYQEADRSIAGAALAALDARKNEHSVALLLIEFEGWERPRVREE